MNKFFKRISQFTADLISRPQFKITLIYAIIGFLWIFFSDSLLTLITKDPAVITGISMIKGWGFITATSVLIYILVRDYNVRAKKAFDALSESETKYRELFENANEAIILIEFKTGTFPAKFIDINETACKWLGYSREELIAMSPDGMATIVFKRDLNEFGKEFSAGNKRKFEITFTRKDGNTFTLEFDINVIDMGGRRIALATARDITDRKKIERNLYFMQFSVNKAAAGIFLVNEAGDIIYANDIQCKRLGYTREELLKLKIGDVGMAARNWKELFKIIRENQTNVIYTEHKRKDGSFYPVEVTTNYFEFEGEGYSFGFALDITERKKAEEALKKSESMYRTLVMTLPDAVTTVDENLYITYASQKTAEMHGYANAEELTGKHIKELYAPEDIQKAESDLKKTVEKGYSNNLQYRLLRKDGTTFIGELNITVLKDNEGKLTGFLGTTRDVTERVEMENEIKESGIRYKRIVDNVIDGLVIIRNGKTDYVSERACEILGYPRQTIMDMKEWYPAAPEEKERILNERKKSLAETKMLPPRQDCWVIRGDGTRIYISSRFSPRFENGEVVDYYVFFTDITERQVAEENLRILLGRLQKSNEELERFAAIASHDLKEPLRMVASYVQLIERRYKGKLDKDADDFINFAVEGVKRMAGLIDDLLAYSKVDSVAAKPDKIDINKVVSGVTNNLKVAIEESKAKIVFDKLPEITANEVQIGQVFQNLISNSIKFRGKEPPKVEIKAKKNRDEWVFSIEDNGIGIDMKYKDKIFVIFQRLHTRTEYPGTGIGLVLCKKIVEKHGGRIWFESEPGKGSIFYFTMPYKIDESKA